MKNNVHFMEAFDHLLGVEGGYVNDENDRGGKTRYGITEAVARSYDYEGPMSELPLNIAIVIYEELYWDVNKLDAIAEVNYDLAYQVFDAGVNTGTQRAGQWLQRSLNCFRRANRYEPLYEELKVDGYIGPVTVEAFETFAEYTNTDLLLTTFRALQAHLYITLCEGKDSQQKFMRGWIKRVQ